MTKFRCTACARSGECEYDETARRCPVCGFFDVVFALAIEEVPDEVIEAIRAPASPGTPDREE